MLNEKLLLIDRMEKIFQKRADSAKRWEADGFNPYQAGLYAADVAVDDFQAVLDELRAEALCEDRATTQAEHDFIAARNDAALEHSS